MRETLDQSACDGAAVVANSLGVSLRFVSEYRHLGAMTTGRCSQKKEVTARCQAARTATVALTSKVLANRSLPRCTRLAVANACCQSRLIRTVGTRERLAREGRRRIYTEFMRPYRIIMECGKRAREGEPVSDAWVRHTLEVAHPEACIMADRLRLVARVLRDAPDGLVALLQSDGARTWRADLCGDLLVMQAVLGKKLELLPSPLVSLAE